MPKKILIVDDEPDVLKMVVITLQSKGYIIITGTNGEEALALLKKENPDIVLLDFRMPVIDGIQTSKRIKTMEDYKHIPVLLITASVDEMESKLEESLADGFLLKPFDPQVLVEEVAKHIGGSE